MDAKEFLIKATPQSNLPSDHYVTEISEIMEDYANYKAQTAKGGQAETLVMPMLTESEAVSGWKDWLNNTFEQDKRNFAMRLKRSPRNGLPENIRQWLKNYYKELLETSTRYRNASKHSA